MENETIQLSAYHEGARIVFAYLNGFTCDSMELPGAGSGSGSKLNAGNDLAVVQDVLSGNPLSLSPEGRDHSIAIARKLMTIYCAGTCAEAFLMNNASIPDELEMEIPGQDLRMIEKIQSFLQKAIIDHPEDYPSQTIISIFKKLKDADVWKAVELLASKVSLQESKTLTRFYIEDTLMMAGIKAQKPAAKSGFNLGVHEDKTIKPSPQETKAPAPDLMSLTPLDVMLRDFLKKIKKDWNPGELDGATAYLHDLYKKFGD